MESEQSIFDESLKNEDLVIRSNKRRGAILIPLKKGKEIAEKIQKELEERPISTKEEMNNA